MTQYLLSIMKGQRKDLSAQLITWALLPLSFIYGLGVFCHRNFYRLKGAYKAPKPVISVGNITVGGTGKTPLVICLTQHLRNQGLSPVILIRGYMPWSVKKIASSASMKLKSLLAMTQRNEIEAIGPFDTSDEADMLKEQMADIPILTGANRVSNIVKSKDLFGVDVYIADDAFQHWPLSRDLNIVAIDAGNPFGNGHLLPAGILREDLRALKRADIFVLTKIEDPSAISAFSSQLKEINPKALIVESRYKNAGVVDVFDSEHLREDFLNHKKVVGISAIGDPFSFKSSLENSGAKIIQLFTYMDHYVYQQEEVENMARFCRLQDSQTLVTTHKDAVKLRIFKDLFAGLRLVYIPIQLEITKGADEFFQKVISVCRH